jgi:hypothetical protein
MVQPRHLLLRYGLSLFLAIGGAAVLGAQNAPSTSPDKDVVTLLRQQLAAQQLQIEELRRALTSQQKLLERVAAGDSASSQAQAPPLIASTSPVPIGNAINKPQAAVNPTTNQSSPLSFRIGDADFTPLGFMDMTSIWRSTNVGSGIGTSFNGIPFGNTAAGKLSESRFSPQNSRIGLKVTTNAGSIPVTGYVEADFLGTAPSNLNVSSNSNTLRMRLYWVDVRPGHWEILGGQSWSMLTPGRVGISPMPSDLFYTQDMDTNYQLGLVWTRAPQFRVVYHAKDATSGFHLGFALENPQQFTGAGVTLPSFVGTQVDNNANTAAPNLHPDFQAKMAYDAKASGHAIHIEAAGVFRSFKIEGPTLAPSTIHGGGAEANGLFEIVKNFRLIGTSYYSSGGGRYIFGQGPDFIVRSNGTLSPVHSASGIAGFELQASPKALLYAYYGTAYFQRNFDQYAPGKFYGYGYPGSPTSNNRLLAEYTLGYTHTFFKSPNYGSLQLINQYSYLERTPWAVPSGSPAHAHTNMVYNDLRYTLP